MGFETSAGKIWKKLPREDKKLAAAAFLEDPPPELLAGALSAVIRARKLRPQVARAMSDPALADALSTVPDPGEPVVSSLLIALHLGSRRPLLVAFLAHQSSLMLDAIGRTLETGLPTSSVMGTGKEQILRYVEPFRWPNGRTAAVEVRHSLADLQRNFSAAVHERIIARLVVLVFFVVVAPEGIVGLVRRIARRSRA